MKKLYTPVLLLISTISVYAQEAKIDTLQPKFVKQINKATTWLSDNGFQIRRTFDGSKNESKPSGISWNSDYENKKFFNVIDAGIKLSQLELFPNSVKVVLLFYPKVEWHRNTITDEDKRKNNLTGGLNSEFIWSIGDKWYENPYVTGSFDYKKDFVKDLKTTQTKGYFSFSGSKEGEPGAAVRNTTDDIVFRYYPYTGIEHYRSIGKTGQKASMWANRLYFELYPLSRYGYKYIQLSADFTYRKVFSDDLYNQGNLDWLVLSFNFYPGGSDKLGLGLDYSQGEDPTSNFIKTKLLALGIKLKI